MSELAQATSKCGAEPVLKVRSAVSGASAFPSKTAASVCVCVLLE